jgi:hypothetical protein
VLGFGGSGSAIRWDDIAGSRNSSFTGASDGSRRSGQLGSFASYCFCHSAGGTTPGLWSKRQARIGRGQSGSGTAVVVEAKRTARGMNPLAGGAQPRQMSNNPAEQGPRCSLRLALLIDPFCINAKAINHHKPTPIPVLIAAALFGGDFIWAV